MHWDRTERPGVYRLEWDDGSVSPASEHVAVNVDPTESDLRRMDRSSLIGSMSGVAVEYVEGNQLTSQRETETRQELWPTLLVALITVLMTEQTLAWWFGTRK